MKVNDNFIFCASTCAFQIEGGRNLGGRTDSIWDEFTKRNFYIPPVGVADREINLIDTASDFYTKYKTDAKIMNRLGLQGLIYNIDWTRIFPKNENFVNPEGVKFYFDVFEHLNKNNVKPIPILFHWDTPLWAQVRGGWEERDILEWFRNYVKIVFKFLGKQSDIWFVNDENSTFTLDGYLGNYLPPQIKKRSSWVRAVHYLNMAAAICKEEFELAKKLNYVNHKSILGIVHDWSPGIPYSDDDNQAVKEYNIWYKDLWLDPNFKGTYPNEFYEFIKKEKINFEILDSDLVFLKENKLDLIGWNYYRPNYISKTEIEIENQKKPCGSFLDKKFKIVYPIKNVEYTKWNWVINPKKLIDGAIELQTRYNKPLMIVENGLGDFDDKSSHLIVDYDRINYLKIHIIEVIKAIQEGINFIGYSLWTYCDIYSPSGGYRKDYGLISVDFNDPNRTRKPKLSYMWYKEVISSRGEILFNNKKNNLEKKLEKELKDWDIFLS